MSSLYGEIERALLGLTKSAEPLTEAEYQQARAAVERNNAAIRSRTARRATEAAQAAIGKRFKVRTGKNAAVAGVVSRCEFANTRDTQRTCVARFRLWLRGPNGTEHGPFTVELLPR